VAEPDRSGIFPNPYSLEGGYHEGRFVLGQSADGWEVSYCFYGRQHNRKFYADEEHACADLYDRVRGYVHRYVCGRPYPSEWRYVTTAVRDVFYVEGEAVPLSALRGAHTGVVLEDPYYGQPQRMQICEVQLRGKPRQFAFGEVSASVFICYVNEGDGDSPETMFFFYRQTLRAFGMQFMKADAVEPGDLDIDALSFLNDRALALFCERGWITAEIRQTCVQIRNEITAPPASRSARSPGERNALRTVSAEIAASLDRMADSCGFDKTIRK